MTDTAAPAPAAGTDPSQGTFWGMLHHNVDLFTSSMERFLPTLRAIATNQALDDGVQAMVAAFAGPMGAEVFAAVIALLKAAPEDQEAAAFGLLKAVVHQPAAAPAKPQATFTPARPADGNGAQQAAQAQARTAPAVV